MLRQIVKFRALVHNEGVHREEVMAMVVLTGVMLIMEAPTY